MKTQPEQQTIPGLPKPDRRRELRAAIDFHRKEADAARKEMQVAGEAADAYSEECRRVRFGEED